MSNLHCFYFYFRGGALDGEKARLRRHLNDGMARIVERVVVGGSGGKSCTGNGDQKRWKVHRCWTRRFKCLAEPGTRADAFIFADLNCAPRGIKDIHLRLIALLPILLRLTAKRYTHQVDNAPETSAG